MFSLADTRFPRMARVRQHFVAPEVADIPQAVRAELESLTLAERIKPGDTVAVTAGSRGIANIALIIRTVVDYLKTLGAQPFIVPAMGSHGGATAEGQCEILRHYGITETTMDVPIRATMEVVKVGTIVDGMPVNLDRNAYSADHIAVVNRVKPHTDFRGRIESGLCKMMAIGLGKQAGAQFYHRAFFQYEFEPIVRQIARRVLETGKVAFGLAIVENAYESTAKVVGLHPDEIETTEPKLLEEARGLMARLPFDRLDLLIVDEMGKNISGTGMDTNIIGRLYQDNMPEPESPKILRIFVRDLTEMSGGNAAGIGFADVTTTRLVRSIDRASTYMNAFTAGTPIKMRTPLHFDTDREALAWVLNTIGLTPSDRSRTVRIFTTLHLDEVLISEVLLDEAKERPDLEILNEPEEMTFDARNNLTPFYTSALH
jgi:hypothetical protein